MKNGHVIAAAVLLAPIPFMGMTEPAAANSIHTVVVKGTVRAYDGGPVFGGSHNVTKTISRTVDLRHGGQDRHLRFTACAGGETRADLIVDLRLNSAEQIVADSTLYLFEGSSCNSDDQDGSQSVRNPKPISIDQSRHRFLKVFNNEFQSFDFVTADFTVTHNVQPPKEPSGLVATHVQGDMHTIHLAWEDNATDETGYEVRNTTTGATARIAPNRTTIAWPSPLRFKQCFQVRALGNPKPSNWSPANPQAACGI
jgi:hypothetical protein